MRNVNPDEWARMTEAEQVAFAEENEKPYRAYNGHTMEVYPQWHNGRPIYSSAFATCVDDCPACNAGGSLDEWEPMDEEY